MTPPEAERPGRRRGCRPTRASGSCARLCGTAGKAVYGPSLRVGTARGRVQDWVLTTTHPSAVLRADDRRSAYDELVADLRVVAGLLR